MTRHVPYHCQFCVPILISILYLKPITMIRGTFEIELILNIGVYTFYWFHTSATDKVLLGNKTLKWFYLKNELFGEVKALNVIQMSLDTNLPNTFVFDLLSSENIHLFTIPMIFSARLIKLKMEVAGGYRCGLRTSMFTYKVWRNATKTRTYHIHSPYTNTFSYNMKKHYNKQNLKREFFIY